MQAQVVHQQDDFNDDAINPALWIIGNTVPGIPAVNEINQRMEITNLYSTLSQGENKQ